MSLNAADSSVEGMGDFDSDGELTVADVNSLSAAVAGDSSESTWDLNTDDVVDARDIHFWVAALKSTSLGDANLDGSVKFDDFMALSGNFGQPGGWGEGDFDGNGTVNFTDFLVLSQNFGSVAEAASASAASVPEPTGISIALFGLLGMIGFRKRR